MTIEQRLDDYKKRLRNEKDADSRRILLEKYQALRSTMSAVKHQDNE